MDTGTLITASLIITGCSIPFVIMHIKHLKKENAIKQILFRTARENNCSISEFNILNSIAIGLDKAAGKLLYTSKRNERETALVITLSGIQKCRLVTSVTDENKEHGNIHFDKLALVFSYKEGRRPDDVLEFYNTSFDSFNLAGEYQLAEKWCKIINEQKGNAA